MNPVGGTHLASNHDAEVAGCDHPSIAILLCTMQGKSYLKEQLDSILHQSYRYWTLWVSDDGSNDGTHQILESYQSQLGMEKLSIHSGPAEGFAANFLSLTCNASIIADYYAYADQDDVWEKNKLTRAVRWLKTVPAHVPALYCSRTCNVDINNQQIGFSRLFQKPPSFANALVQNIGGGNTMVFNEAARNLLRSAGFDVTVVAHDWWAYMVISGCGGRVFYDSQPSVRYRQHGANLIGANNSFADSLARVKLLLGGRFKIWNDTNIKALEGIRGKLTPENQIILDQYSRARHSSFFLRLLLLKRSGVYRQTLIGNLGFIAAAIFNKI